MKVAAEVLFTPISPLPLPPPLGLTLTSPLSLPSSSSWMKAAAEVLFRCVLASVYEVVSVGSSVRRKTVFFLNAENERFSS